MPNKIQKFFDDRRADEIVYALKMPAYYGLTEDECTELHGLVFNALDDARNLSEVK